MRRRWVFLADHAATNLGQFLHQVATIFGSARPYRSASRSPVTFGLLVMHQTQDLPRIGSPARAVSTGPSSARSPPDLQLFDRGGPKSIAPPMR